MSISLFNADLRSDTVTKPSPEMLDAMFRAPVGDDVYGEDPTVNELESYAASLFGKEAGLFCASGTQTNQIAISVHVKPGDEVICHEESHVYKYEGGGIARNSGASVRLLRGNRGRLIAEEIAQFINPDDVHLPVTRLISLEDTANRGGGAIYDYREITRIAVLAQARELPLHLDGARVMNALAVTGMKPSEYASVFDSVSICLSKGLGAPVGSVLVGSSDFIQKARRVRKVMGGGMRQAGIIAAGGLYALKNNVERLQFDHLAAQNLALALQDSRYVQELLPVETNIVVALMKNHEDRDLFIRLMGEKNVLCSAFGPGMVRFVTHMDYTEEQQEYVEKTIRSL